MNKKCAVLGSGTMGRGIAYVAVQSGFETVLFDIDSKSLKKGEEGILKLFEGGVQRGKITTQEKKAGLERLSFSDDLSKTVEGCGLIIEAIPENFDLKKNLFQKVERLVSDKVLLVSNTSSLSISQLAQSLKNPSRFLGFHFFNPPHILTLLEMVTHEALSPDALHLAGTYSQALGRVTITVRDSPGFASSRLGIALAMEAIRMVEEGVASPEDIDKAMEAGYAHPMGPLKLTDHVGCDVRLAITEHLFKELGSAVFNPPPLLKKMVSEGKLGKKSGHGFYLYSK